uniref:Metalloendopeptidase n=1 Tax=Oryzias latipes TaxID=8090 RepID=A0A3B3IG27_ORYLA
YRCDPDVTESGPNVLCRGRCCGGGCIQGAICWRATGKSQQRPQYVNHIVALTHLNIQSRICSALSCGAPAEPDLDEPLLIGGDIAIRSEADKNADPCTSRGCLWLKYTDGNVYIPYYIADYYTSRERAIIVRGLESFSDVSCIRFRPYQNGDHEWLSIESRNGCYSYVGRQGGGQTVSLSRQGCLYHSTVQHELLHALGFNHEQTRSDRDNHIKVHWENIIDDMEYNFYKIDTLNQGTPYDYNSVMQYERYAFSKNNLPTMEPIPDSNVSFGQATQMSKNDIDRLNRLYNC